jgi:DNA-binding NarL/FixJ family response regulator
MPNALTRSPRAPRPLPGDELLSAGDHRRLFGVIEAVDRAADLPEFRARLVHALQDWFGFRGVAVLHGDTLVAAVGSDCGVVHGYAAGFLDEYAARWISADPFRDEGFFPRMLSAGVVRLSDIAAGTQFVDVFLRRHQITDKAAMVIDGSPAGVIYVGMSVQEEPRVPERDLAVLRALRRHLAPLAVQQLARHREQQAAMAGWHLTPREQDVAELAAKGLTNRQIADRLFITVDTVKKHLTRVFAATGCATRAQLAARYSATAASAGPDPADGP